MIFLREGLLEGIGVAVVGGPAILERLLALGGASSEAPDTLVFDASSLGDPRAALDGAWAAIRPVAVSVMIPRGSGQIVFVAPPPGDAPAEAARAGLENLARTLSVEWARFGVRPVTILPGSATSPAEVAELVCFLASEAGGYYAGCAFTLGSATAGA